MGIPTKLLLTWAQVVKACSDYSYFMKLALFFQAALIYQSFPTRIRCDRCLDDIFHTRPVARCDTCLADRRRTDYFPKIFDSGEVHREVFVRKHDVGDFALVRQEDMPGDTPEEKLNHYNDYLEEVEDITYALTYHAKSEATVNRIESLLGRFGHIIQANKKREADQQRQRVLELRVCCKDGGGLDGFGLIPRKLRKCCSDR